ncbi:MAG: DoxX family membrane protein [Puniceicoccales bacterium]|jgi:putative oxidoreductase|nr:DoxX family membrane protein [Puniceicoccales bacterium]
MGEKFFNQLAVTTSINFDSESFGKLFIRIFIGIFFMVNGVHFFMGGHAALATLGKILGMVGINFSPVLFGGVLAAIHIVCGLTLIIGFLFRTSCFLLGLISFLKALIALFAGKNILNDVAHIFTLSMVTVGMMFIGGGKFSAKK